MMKSDTSSDIEETHDNKITKFIDNLNCCGQMMLLICGVGCIVGYIVLIVYDINALKDNSMNDVHDICTRSDLWEFLFVSVIMIPINHIITFLTKKVKIQLTTPILLLIWGSTELFGIECVKDLNHMNIYHMSLIHVILGYVCIPLVIANSCYKDYNKQK